MILYIILLTFRTISWQSHLRNCDITYHYWDLYTNDLFNHFDLYRTIWNIQCVMKNMNENTFAFAPCWVCNVKTFIWMHLENRSTSRNWICINTVILSINKRSRNYVQTFVLLVKYYLTSLSCVHKLNILRKLVHFFIIIQYFVIIHLLTN